MNNRVSSFNTNNDGVDRIISLPDEILTHILSFLSTKEAVQTCVLSKRWKYTWAAVPILDIKHEDFCIDDNCSRDRNEEQRMSVAKFERFMTGFLDNRAPTNLDRVCCMRIIEGSQPDVSIGWLDRVALLMPRQIDIVCFTYNSLDVPDLLFSCASLQQLSMSLYTKVKTIIRPVSINLPSLKFLELTRVELHDDFAQKLFMGCPSLERLKLYRCDLNFSSISSDVLKELTLDSCCLYEQMQISCPELVSLFMRIYFTRGGISLKNMSSLVNVAIQLFRYFTVNVPVLNLFGGLSNAAKLELYLGTSGFKEQLEKDIPNCRNFNLKKLVVGGWDMSNDFYLIACLLKCFPNLKELGLFFHESLGQIQEHRPEGSGDVLFHYEYLETVEIGVKYGAKLSSEQINAIIKTLGTYVKKIGNLIIT